MGSDSSSKMEWTGKYFFMPRTLWTMSFISWKNMTKSCSSPRRSPKRVRSPELSESKRWTWRLNRSIRNQFARPYAPTASWHRLWMAVGLDIQSSSWTRRSSELTCFGTARLHVSDCFWNIFLAVSLRWLALAPRSGLIPSKLVCVVELGICPVGQPAEHSQTRAYQHQQHSRHNLGKQSKPTRKTKRPRRFEWL